MLPKITRNLRVISFLYFRRNHLLWIYRTLYLINTKQTGLEKHLTDDNEMTIAYLQVLLIRNIYKND